MVSIIEMTVFMMLGGHFGRGSYKRGIQLSSTSKNISSHPEQAFYDDGLQKSEHWRQFQHLYNTGSHSTREAKSSNGSLLASLSASQGGCSTYFQLLGIKSAMCEFCQNLMQRKSVEQMYSVFFSDMYVTSNRFANRFADKSLKNDVSIQTF